MSKPARRTTSVNNEKTIVFAAIPLAAIIMMLYSIPTQQQQQFAMATVALPPPPPPDGDVVYCYDYLTDTTGVESVCYTNREACENDRVADDREVVSNECYERQTDDGDVQQEIEDIIARLINLQEEVEDERARVILAGLINVLEDALARLLSPEDALARPEN
jgi:hypothetical protein